MNPFRPTGERKHGPQARPRGWIRRILRISAAVAGVIVAGMLLSPWLLPLADGPVAAYFRDPGQGGLWALRGVLYAIGIGFVPVLIWPDPARRPRGRARSAQLTVLGVAMALEGLFVQGGLAALLNWRT